MVMMMGILMATMVMVDESVDHHFRDALMRWCADALMLLMH